jgi:hypothetical protein
MLTDPARMRQAARQEFNWNFTAHSNHKILLADL